MTESQPSEREPDQGCDHEWVLVNRDENRLIYKCVRCGGLRRE